MEYSEMKDRCVRWIRDWFDANGKDSVAVLGMSGGKDSTVAAALCAEALGPDRVVGVAMPSRGQSLNEADQICRYLGIRYLCVPIGDIIDSFSVVSERVTLSAQAEQNIPPRVRMSVLYAVSQSLNGRVANTCNLSENWVGYATRWGDSVGDFSPLGELVVQEIRGIGHSLGIPSRWVDKTPDDGLPHSCSDEQKFGFTYEVLDRYIRTGECDDPAIREKIDSMHRRNLFKMEMPESFSL
ncbi:MAG: NAD(+) synthase [Bacteroidales bacterium]|nr:NAD(+) synthase [Bacteroidales bacterium]